MSKPINIIGKSFGMLTVVELAGYKKVGSRQRRLFRCLCGCGRETFQIYGSLVSGGTRSCGCRQHPKTHGESKSRLYSVWRAMHDRCERPSDARFKNYGGRGIKACERWKDYATFKSDMGPRPVGGSIERTNVNGHYEPANCRWATNIEQANNTRRTRLIVFQGESLTIAQWARRLGVTPSRIEYRLRVGWPVEEAFTIGWSRGKRRDLKR